eukprot:4748771-Amphidinium_carterae.1
MARETRSMLNQQHKLRPHLMTTPASRKLSYKGTPIFPSFSVQLTLQALLSLSTTMRGQRFTRGGD